MIISRRPVSGVDDPFPFAPPDEPDAGTGGAGGAPGGEAGAAGGQTAAGGMGGAGYVEDPGFPQGGTGGLAGSAADPAHLLGVYADILGRFPRARLANVAGDSREDVVAHDVATSRVLYFKREGKSFAAERVIERVGGQWQIVAAGRFDERTPFAQIVLQETNSTGRVASWKVNDGVHAGLAFDVTLSAGLGWRIGSQADLDGNGVADLVWSSATGQVVVWYMRSGVASSTRMLAATAEPPWALEATSDVDRDGHLDLVWSHAPTERASVWKLAQSGLRGAVLINPSPGPRKVNGARDVDGDGAAELLMRQGAAGPVELWSLDAAGQAQRKLTIFTDLPADWSRLPPLDVDGDGRTDEIWRRTNGDAVAWVFDSSGIKRQIFVRFGERSESTPAYGACTCRVP